MPDSIPATPAAAGAGLAAARRGNVLHAIAWMIVCGMCMTAMQAMVKHLADAIHPFEVAFFRNFLGLVLLAGWFTRIGWTALRSGNMGLHLARAAVNAITMLCYFMGLSLAPLPTVTSLGFTAQLFATVGAIAFLGERIRLRRTLALLLGFAGVVVVVRPGFAAVGAGELLIIISSLAWAAALLLIKTMARTDSAWTITAYMNLLLSPLTLIPALFVWRWPDLTQFFWLFALASAGTLGQTALNQALREAEVAVVMPFDFLRLVWAGMFSIFVFGEFPGPWTLVGGAMIVASTSYIAYRESVLRRQATPRDV